MSSIHLGSPGLFRYSCKQIKSEAFNKCDAWESPRCEMNGWWIRPATRSFRESENTTFCQLGHTAFNLETTVEFQDGTVCDSKTKSHLPVKKTCFSEHNQGLVGLLLLHSPRICRGCAPWGTCCHTDTARLESGSRGARPSDISPSPANGKHLFFFPSELSKQTDLPFWYFSSRWSAICIVNTTVFVLNKLSALPFPSKCSRCANETRSRFKYSWFQVSIVLEFRDYVFTAESTLPSVLYMSNLLLRQFNFIGTDSRQEKASWGNFQRNKHAAQCLLKISIPFWSVYSSISPSSPACRAISVLVSVTPPVESHVACNEPNETDQCESSHDHFINTLH